MPRKIFVISVKHDAVGLTPCKSDEPKWRKFNRHKAYGIRLLSAYVEPKYRNRGIAGKMLNFACEDMKAKGIDTLYLLTDHTNFYERYGWEFLCMVQGDGETELSRMYRHKC